MIGSRGSAAIARAETRVLKAALAAALSALALAVPANASTTPAFTLGPDGPAAQVATNAIAVTKVCPGDFNGDGNTDVAAAVHRSSGGDGVYVAFGDGTGHLGAFTFLANNGGTDPRCIAADFNSDGRSDLAIVDRGSTGVTLEFGQSNGTFTSGGFATTGVGVGDVATGDFNGDGKIDLVTGNMNGAQGSDTASLIAISLGDGTGGFSAGPGTFFNTATDAPPSRVITADLNADGRSEVLLRTNGATKHNLYSFLAAPDGSIAQQNKFVFDTGIDMAPGVIDTDGKMDLVYASGARSQAALGDGAGGFANDSTNFYPLDATTLAQTNSIALADLNNDGLLDMALGDGGGRTDGNTDVWTEAGNGASSAPFFDQTAEGPFVIDSTSNSLDVASIVPVDINNDGRLDLVAGTTNSVGGVAVLLNTTPVPTVVTGPPSAVNGSNATVTGTVGTSGLSSSYGVDLISAGGTVFRQAPAGTLSSGTSAVSIPISGLTPQTTYRYRVYATNANGTTVGQIKTFTTTIAAPANSSPPQISGVAQPGLVLTCDPGSWSGNPTFAFQWLRGGVALAGETANTHTVTASDVGGTLSCRVTASNAGGSTNADSPGTGATATPQPPQNVTAPRVTGTGKVGQTLACAAGNWIAGGTFDYAWLRDGTAIPKATAAGYTVVRADRGHVLKCRVTVTNPDGNASADSNGVPVKPSACVVPRLRGKTVPAAKRALLAAGCRAGRVVRQPSTVRPGRVLKTTPKAGARRRLDTKVTLFVSR